MAKSLLHFLYELFFQQPFRELKGQVPKTLRWLELPIGYG